MIALALLLAAGAPQAKPAAKAAPARPAAPGPGQTQMSMKVSPAGQAVIKKFLSAPDPEFVALGEKLKAAAQQTKGLAAGDKLDMGRLEQLLREQEQIKSQMQKRSDDRLLAMLGEMSEADRIGFARGTVTVGAQPRPAPSR